MADIEEALAKARALAKAAKAGYKSRSRSRSPIRSSGGGLAAVGAARASGQAVALLGGPPGGERGLGGLSVTRNINHTAPHMRAQTEGRRLFIGGMSYETTDQSLEAYLNMRWPTEECKVKRDMDGRSRGFAFISFPSVSVLEACFEQAPHYIDGKKVEMRKVSADGGGSWGSNGPADTRAGAARGGGAETEKRANQGMTRYGGGGPNTTRVYIGSAPTDTSRYRGLNDNIQDEDLKSYFERYGTVTGVAQHKWEDTGRKKGFGYIEFSEYTSAQSSMGCHTVCGQDLEVKSYNQGGVRTPSSGPPSYGAGASAGYGRPEARSSGSSAENPAAMMDQMKSMMVQMQQMQQQMASGAAPSSQMQTMQQQMYAMMQSQYYQGYGGYGQAGYQYPTGGIEYPKPTGTRDPKPPGTDY